MTVPASTLEAVGVGAASVVGLAIALLGMYAVGVVISSVGLSDEAIEGALGFFLVGACGMLVALFVAAPSADESTPEVAGLAVGGAVAAYVVVGVAMLADRIRDGGSA